MCGLAGWADFGRDLCGEASTGEAMAAVLACRGPDSAGVRAERNAVPAHRRLAVIDLAGGAQPMTAETPEGAVVLVYTGEVYNFAALRTELRALADRNLHARDRTPHSSS